MRTLYLALYEKGRALYGPRTAILLQVGKFYELYDEVAPDGDEGEQGQAPGRAGVPALADACGLSLSEKPLPRGGVALFGGFPEATLPKYERLLVQEGYTVVVHAQVKGLDGTIRRELHHVASPGTVVGEGGATADRFLWGLALHADGGGLVTGAAACLLASTGFTAVGEVLQGAWSAEAGVGLRLDEADALLSVRPAAEVVVWWSAEEAVGTAALFTEASLRRALRLSPKVLLHVWPHPAKAPGAVRREEDALASAFGVARPAVVASLHLQRRPCVRAVLARLLEFAASHAPALAARLTLPCEVGGGGVVGDHCGGEAPPPPPLLRLANHAAEQLGMVNAAEPRCSYLWFLSKARTSAGARALRARLLQPLTDAGLLRARLARVEAWRAWRVASPPAAALVERSLLRVCDVEKLLRRLRQGSPKLGDVVQTLQTVEAVEEVRRGSSSGGPLLPSLSEASRAALAALQARWDGERLEAVRGGEDGGGGWASGAAALRVHPWRRGVRPRLDAAEDAWVACLASLEAFLRSAVAGGGAEDEAHFTAAERPDAPLAPCGTKRRCERLASWLRSSGDGTARAVEVAPSRGGGGLHYVTCASVEALNQSAVPVLARWGGELDAAWLEEGASMAADEPLLEALQATGATATEADVELCLARVAEEYDYVSPEVLDPEPGGGSGVWVQGLRHGASERVHTDTPYVPHDLALGCLGGTEGPPYPPPFPLEPLDRKGGG